MTDTAAGGRCQVVSTRQLAGRQLMRRARLIAILAAADLLAGIGAAVAHASAVPDTTWHGHPIRICASPGHARNNGVTTGEYRVTDEAWLGRLCILVTGPNQFKVTSSLPALAAVGAYPNIMTGTHYDQHTPLGWLPVRVSAARHHKLPVTVRIGAPYSPRSVWLGDLDNWFFPTSDVSGRGTLELVVITRYARGWRFSSHARQVTIGGRRWRVDEWITCQRLRSGACDPSVPAWPLLEFALVHPAARVTVPMGSVINLSVRRHLMPAGMWWANLRLGAELGAGGKGMTFAMTVGPAGWPVLRKLVRQS